MYERIPQQKKETGDELRLLGEADWVVNSMWEKAMDIDDLPLDWDSSYQAWEGDFAVRKHEFARALFDAARNSSGDDKLRAAVTLNRLLKLAGKDKQAILGELMTTEEAVHGLMREGERAVAQEQSPIERAKAGIKKTIDKFLYRDDDFGSRLK